MSGRTDRLCKLACTLSLALWACASAPEPAPEPLEKPVTAPVPGAASTPEASALFERNITALGGRQRLLSTQSLIIEGTMSMPTQGIDATIVIAQQAPNRMLMRMSLPGFGEIIEGFDGKVAWAIDPVTGPRLKEGAELADTRRRADLHAVVHYDQHYATFETVGRVEFQGTQVWDVRLVTAEGREEHAYFDVDSGLRIGTVASIVTEMGDVPVIAKYSRFESVGGSLQPMRIEQRQGAMLSVIEVTSIRENVPELPSFDPPKEISAMLAADAE